MTERNELRPQPRIRRFDRFHRLGPDLHRPRFPAECQWCRRSITQPETGRPRMYCRQSCRQRAYERRRVWRALQEMREQRDRVLDRLRHLQELADEVAPFAWSAPDAPPPDPARLAIAVVQLAYWGRRF